MEPIRQPEPRRFVSFGDRLRVGTVLDLAAQNFDWALHQVERQRGEKRAGDDGVDAKSRSAVAAERLPADDVGKPEQEPCDEEMIEIDAVAQISEPRFPAAQWCRHDGEAHDGAQRYRQQDVEDEHVSRSAVRSEEVAGGPSVEIVEPMAMIGMATTNGMRKVVSRKST